MSTDNRTQRELMSADWSMRLVLVFIGLPSLGFAIVSGMFNASYASRLGGSEREQMIWIAASILITAFVAGLPLAIEILRARVPHLAVAARVLWLASMAFSFIAALGYAAATRGEATATTGAAISNRAALERSIARGEAELAALPSHRPASTVSGEIRVAAGQAGVNCARAKSRVSRELCAPVYRLESELAAAEDAVRIEAQLARQRSQLNGVSVVGTSANPQADMLAWIGAGVLSADTWERVLTVFAAGLIEVSAAFGLSITARSVVELTAPTPAPVEEVKVELVEEPERIELTPSPIAAVEPELGWQMWFQSCVSAQQGGKVTPKDAYSNYERWASLNNVAGVLPYISFGKRMNEAVNAMGGKISRSSKERFYADVSLTKLGENGVPLLEGEKEVAE